MLQEAFGDNAMNQNFFMVQTIQGRTKVCRRR